jgi:hypothetical protein
MSPAFAAQVLREEEERNRHTPPASISEGMFFAATAEDLARVLLLLLPPPLLLLLLPPLPPVLLLLPPPLLLLLLPPLPPVLLLLLSSCETRRAGVGNQRARSSGRACAGAAPLLQRIILLNTRVAFLTSCIGHQELPPPSSPPFSPLPLPRSMDVYTNFRTTPEVRPF